MARSLDHGKSWLRWDPESWSPWRNTCYEIAFDPNVPGKMWGAFSDVHDISQARPPSESRRREALHVIRNRRESRLQTRLPDFCVVETGSVTPGPGRFAEAARMRIPGRSSWLRHHP